MKYIKRILEDRIVELLSRKEIIAIQGVRQCGKTTLIKKIQQDLLLKNKKCVYISFDDLKILNMFVEDVDSFIEIYVKPNEYLFIDEIQYALNSGKILKYIHDTNDIKIIISGSSALEISVQSLKYLVGRIIVFELYPFSFEEFLMAKDESLLPVYKKGLFKTEVIKLLNNYLDEFLIYGGFPGVVVTKNKEHKTVLLQNIYNTYMLREIKELFDLGEDFKLHNLIKMLSLQSGNLINYKELGTSTGLSYTKLKNYLTILEKTYIIKLLHPYFMNKRNELVKNPKIYFYDSGFKNSCLNNFSTSVITLGAAYEEFVFSELKKQDLNLKFWQSKSKAEVDFIIEKNGVIPIEVKLNLDKAQITRSFYSFIEKYTPSKAYVISKIFEGEKNIGKTKVVFLPFVKLHKLLSG